MILQDKEFQQFGHSNESKHTLPEREDVGSPARPPPDPGSTLTYSIYR